MWGMKKNEIYNFCIQNNSTALLSDNNVADMVKADKELKPFVGKAPRLEHLTESEKRGEVLVEIIHKQINSKSSKIKTEDTKEKEKKNEGEKTVKYKRNFL